MEQNVDDYIVQCPHCPQRFRNRLWLSDHVLQVHERVQNFACMHDGCGKIYNNRNSLRSHIYRKHNIPECRLNASHQPILPNESAMDIDVVVNTTGSSSPTRIPVVPGNVDVASSNPPDHCSHSASVPQSAVLPEDAPFHELNYDSDEDPEPDDDPDPDYDPDIDVDDVPDGPQKQMIAEYLLYLRGRTRATNADVLGILAKLQQVVEWYVHYYLEKVEGRLQREAGFRLRDYIDIEDTIAGIDCSQGLHSIYNQNVYFQEKFDVVEPLRYELGRKFVPYGTPTVDGNQRIRQKSDELIYVPITQVLEKWMKNGSFGGVLSRPKVAKDGILASYLDGTHFQTHPFKQLRPNAKFIKLFFDECEMCDPLGPKSGSVNKLGMFYWMDEEVSAEHRSQLKFINLAAVVPNPHIKKYGMNKILAPIVDDLKKLQVGIDASNGAKVHGTISTLVGDNLAAHQVCGFRESFSALHPCRYCSATLDDVRTMTREDPTLLRTKEIHDAQVAEIEAADEETARGLKTNYGVNKRCVLNELEGFHVTSSVPPDTVHDDKEGIGMLTSRLFMKILCLDSRLMSLDELNERIANYDYGYTEKSSRPSTITREQLLDGSTGLRQTAAQMSQLLTMLPLIVVDFVPDEWPPLENYVQMLEIMAISDADEIKVSSLDYLSSIISEYLETFQSIYNRTLIPKQHFLLHRPGLIKKFGPLNQYKTIRQEGKHQVFKRFAQCLRTYCHLALTSARKHELYQASIRRENLVKPIRRGPTKWFPVEVLPFKEMFPQEIKRVRTTNWIEVNGKKYVASKCYLAVGYSKKNIPKFAALHTIVWRHGAPRFICRTVTTVQHDTTINSYEVEIKEEYISLAMNDLFSPEVFISHRLGNRTVITIEKALGSLH